MTRAGVAEENIVTHVRAHGMVAPLQATDLVFLSQQGVSPRVIQAMQQPPQMAGPPPMVAAPGPPVIVEHYGPPPVYWGPAYRHCHRRGGVSWGVAFGN
jgi:hypothetical protein